MNIINWVVFARKQPQPWVKFDKVKDNGDFYCDNLDLKVLPEGLNKYFNVELIARKSNSTEN